MSDMPERIWVETVGQSNGKWFGDAFEVKGGWNDAPDRRESEYVRADIHAATLAANAALVVRLDEARDGIIKGMHIALTTPIEQVPEAIAAAIRALPAPTPTRPPEVDALVRAMQSLIDRYDEVVTTPDCSCGQDDHDVQVARAALTTYRAAKEASHE